MNTDNWEKDDFQEDAESYPCSAVEEILVINWRLILQIEREQEEQRELAREFEEELDALFAWLRLSDEGSDHSPDPPGWPNL